MAEGAFDVPVDVELKIRYANEDVRSETNHLIKNIENMLGSIDTSKMTNQIATGMNYTAKSLEKLKKAFATYQAEYDKIGQSTDAWHDAKAKIDQYEQKITDLRNEYNRLNKDLANGTTTGGTPQQITQAVFHVKSLSAALEEATKRQDAAKASVQKYWEEYRKYRDIAKEWSSGKRGQYSEEVQQQRAAEYSGYAAAAKKRALRASASVNLPNSAINKEVTKLTQDLEAAQKQLAEYQKYSKMDEATTEQFKNRVAALAEQISQLVSEMNALKNEDYTANMGAESLGRVQELLRELQGAFVTAQGEASNLGDKLNEQASQSSQSGQVMANVWLGLKNVIRSVTSALANGMSKAISLYKSGITHVLRFGKALLTLHKHAKKSGDGMKKLSKTLTMYVFGFRSAYYMIKRLRTVFIEQFKSMAAQIPTINTQISSFMTKLNQLKASWAAAFQPIVSAVIPYVNALMDKLSAAMDKLGRFFATLTGQNYIIKATANQVDYAASLNNTADAAKDAKRQLMGFDEINRLDDDTDSSSSSGSTDDDAIAKYSMEALTEGLTIDPYQLGYNLMTKIMTALDLIDWQAVQEKVSSIGVTIARFFNGIFDNSTAWATLGADIANGISTAFTFAQSLLNQLNLNSLGLSISKAISNFTANINWNSITNTFYLLGYQLANLLNGVVSSPTTWKVVGYSIGKAINSLITLVKSFVDNLDWSSLTESLVNMITGAFDEFDAEGAGDTISKLAVNILDLLTAAVKAIDTDKIGEMFQSVDWYSVGTSLWNLLVEGLGKASDILMSLLGSIAHDFWEKMKEAWGIDENTTDEEMGKAIVNGLFEGIGNALGDIGDWIKEHIFDPFIKGFKDLFGINSPSTVMKEQGEYITEGITKGVESKFQDVIDKFTELKDSIVSKVAEAWDSLKTGAADAWDGIKEPFLNMATWFGDTFSEAWQKVKDVFNSGGEIFVGIKDGIVDAFKAIVNSLIDGINWVIAQPFQGVNDALSSIRSISIFGATPFSGIGYINIPTIPHLATGAVIPPNKEFLAMLGDQSSGTNVEAPLATIQQAVADVFSTQVIQQMAQAFAQAMRSNGGNTVTLNVNGKEFARAIYNDTKTVAREKGISLVNA